jgi:hypothetical protein
MDMTYKINYENSGLDTNDQVRKMVKLATERGYDVEFTSNYGDVQGYDDNGDSIRCPIPDQEWMALLELASV